MEVHALGGTMHPTNANSILIFAHYLNPSTHYNLPHADLLPSCNAVIKGLLLYIFKEERKAVAVVEMSDGPVFQ